MNENTNVFNALVLLFWSFMFSYRYFVFFFLVLSLPTDPISLSPILPTPIIASYCLIQLCRLFWQKDQDALGFTIMHHADLCYLIKGFSQRSVAVHLAEARALPVLL